MGEELSPGDIVWYQYGGFAGDWEYQLVTDVNSSKVTTFSGFLKRTVETPLELVGKGKKLGRAKDQSGGMGVESRENLEATARYAGVWQ